jgi:serine/threonine-protein kinase
MLFYNMLTGKFAFDSPSYSDVLIKICLEPLPDLAEVAPWVSEPVRLWFSKACARDLAERFQSADEASEALHQAAGQPVGRGSIPDQVMGPSGTVVGYASPDTLAGTLAVDPEHTPIPSRTALLAGPRSSGTAVLEPGSRRAPAAAPMPATVLSGADAGSTWRAARRAAGRPTWPLFLAAGAGIGLALAGAAVLFIATRGEANPTPAAAPSPPAAALPLAPARPEPPAAPLTADPEPSSAPSAAASASAIAPRRPSATKATAPRPAPPPAPPPAEKVAPKRAAPDMGF